MNEQERLDKGEHIFIGHRILAKCPGCGNIIRVNKPIIGSLHLCSEEAAEAERKRTGRA